ncbi:outer membrane channel protein [Phycisphaerae bacterium RAS1]|nr:outer membrane channel protein [Phycisphaerae bacterium RAS1]
MAQSPHVMETSRDRASRRRRTRVVTAGRVACAAALLLCPALLPGCASWYESSADRDVYRALDKYGRRTLGGRQQQVKRPQPLATESQPTSDAVASAQGSATQSAPTDADTPRPADAAAASGPPAPQPGVLPLDLATSLRIGFRSGRDFLDQRDALYRSGLDYSLARFNFGPILDSTISYVWRNTEDQPSSDDGNATLSARQILPTGGTLTGTAQASAARVNDIATPLWQQRFAWDSSLQVSLRQPLLRGVGYEASHEELTAAQRGLIYAVRSFELFRQDFAINVAQVYYGLVSQQVRLANDQQNYLDAVYDRQKAEALRQLDRNKDDDVFLARRREIQSEDALLVSKTDYRLALDNFKILLALPTATEIEIAPQEPEFSAVSFDAASAVDVALTNRLDLHTQRDRVDDAARQVRIAANRLLPNLDLAADYRVSSGPDAGDDATPSVGDGSIGMTLNLPLNRQAERNAFRSAQITLAQARRNLEQTEDEIERDILNQLRVLTQIEKRIALQQDQIAYETRAVEVTRLRYESGDAETRDLLDARQGLTNAQNALINLKVQHFVARLRLMRGLGVLFVVEDGLWWPT